MSESVWERYQRVGSYRFNVGERVLLTYADYVDEPGTVIALGKPHPRIRAPFRVRLDCMDGEFAVVSADELTLLDPITELGRLAL